jgi:hypothetical protein
MAKLTWPEDDEDRRLTEAALDDPDNPLLTAYDFANMRHYKDGTLARPLDFARLHLERLEESLGNVRPEHRKDVAAVLIHIRRAIAAADEAGAHAAE